MSDTGLDEPLVRYYWILEIVKQQMILLSNSLDHIGIESKTIL